MAVANRLSLPQLLILAAKIERIWRRVNPPDNLIQDWLSMTNDEINAALSQMLADIETFVERAT